MPYISIIIPVYNSEKYLHECLDTVLGQTFTNFELICVNDGSTDMSGQILESYADKDKRVKIITQNRKFAGVARNLGLSKATGEYIIFLDSDDFFTIDLLANLYDKACVLKADICVCDARNYKEKTGTFNAPRRFLDNAMLPSLEPFSHKTNAAYIFNFTTPAPWNMLFKRQFLMDNKLQFQEIERSNDLRFTTLALAKAEAIVTVKERDVIYRVRESGNLQSHNDDTPLCFYDALIQIRDELLHMGIMDEVKTSFMNLALDVYLYNIEKLKNPENYNMAYSKLLNEAMKDFYFQELKEDQIYLSVSKRKYYHYLESNQQEILQKKERNIDKRAGNPPISTKTQKQPCVSIIIPVYNPGNYLTACLESVIHQTMKDIEIICINDGSTDQSKEILREYAELDDRIVLVDMPNGGPSRARNYGIETANGKYITFLDSDDAIEKNGVELLWTRAESFNLDIVYFNTTVCFSKEGIVKNEESLHRYYKRIRDYKGVMTGIDIFVMMQRVNEYLPSVCLQFYRKEFLNLVPLRFYDGMIHEDDLFTFQALLQAARVGYLNQILHSRTVRNESIMTKKQNKNHFIGYFTCYAEMIAAVIKFEKDSELSAEATGLVWSHIQNTFNKALGFYRKLTPKEISKIFFEPNSMGERFYASFSKSELELQRIKKSKYYSAGKDVSEIRDRLNSKNKLTGFLGRQIFALLRFLAK
jgi:glycosyltransferase involved in cell wall biosynthesis